MDFELSKEQGDIQKAAREFAEAEFDKDYMLDLELNHKFPSELLKKACELGFISIDFPEEYGGGGYGLVEKALVLEEFSRVGAGVGVSVGSCEFASKMILHSGSEEQKKKYLPEVCNGEALPFAGAFTEPDRGSDLVTFPLSTTAVKEGTDYIINGTKTFITHANMAKYIIVLCQTDPEAERPYRGQSTILIEKPAEPKKEKPQLEEKPRRLVDVKKMKKAVLKKSEEQGIEKENEDGKLKVREFGASVLKRHLPSWKFFRVIREKKTVIGDSTSLSSIPVMNAAVSEDIKTVYLIMRPKSDTSLDIELKMFQEQNIFLNKVLVLFFQNTRH